MEKKLTDREMRVIWDGALKAGLDAGSNHKPRPMKRQWDDESPVAKQWHVPSGVCGFAWVIIASGRHSFARWCRKHNYSHKNYGTGEQIWIREHGQSYEKKMKHAAAFAEVLNLNGIEAYAGGRLD